MANTLKPWRAFTIFVSSTFIDMEAERDYLNNIVIKELEREYEKRRVSLSFIDLRWGVQTDKEASKESRELSVLSVCMEEIKRSRPFFIGLLGDRYGWIPSKERYAQVVERMDEQERQLLKEGEGASVTALEMLFGALGRKELLKRSLFFFRDEASYQGMTPEEQQLYRDPAHADKLAQLKARIRKECERQGLDKVHTYRLEWKEGRFTRLEEWGEMVKKQLRHEIEAELEETADTAPQNWLEMEELQQDIFLHAKTELFVGREKELNDLEKYARTEQGVIVIPGFPTMGKSALLCQLYLRLQNDPHLVPLLHCTSVSKHATYTYRMFCRLSSRLCDVLGQTYAEPSDEGSEARNYFLSLVRQVTESGRKVLLLIDSTDGFLPSDDASNYSWLPDEACCILTCRRTTEGGYESEITLYKTQAQVHFLPFFTPDEAKEMARALCRRYHKNIPEHVLHLIATKQATDVKEMPEGYPLPYYACYDPLWVKQTVWYLVSMNEEDFTKARRITTVSDEEAKLEYYLCQCVESAQIDPVNLIWESIIPRIQQEVEESFLLKTLMLIATSYRGISENDMAAILGNEWNPLFFSKTHHFLKDVLTQDYETGDWHFSHNRIGDFFHEIFAEESLQQFLLVQGRHYTIHEKDCPGAARKAIYFLSRTNQKVWAAYLCALICPNSDVTDMVEEIVQSIKSDQERFLPWFTDMFCMQRDEDSEREIKEEGWNMLERMGYPRLYTIAIEHLIPALFWWRKDVAVTLGAGIENKVKAYVDTHAEQPEVRQLLMRLYYHMADAYEKMGLVEQRKHYAALMEEEASTDSLTAENIGNIALDERRFDEAEEHFMKLYLQSKKTYKSNPYDPNATYNAFMGCMYLADVYRRSDNYDRLKAIVEEGTTYLPLLPKDMIFKRNIGQFCHIAGRLYCETGDHEKALEWLNRSISVLEELYAYNLRDTENTIELGIAYEGLGDYYMQCRAETEALTCYRKQAAIFDSVLAMDQSHMECRHFRLIAACHIWDILSGEETDSQEWYEVNRDLVLLSRDTDPTVLTAFDMEHISPAYFFLHTCWEQQPSEERAFSSKEMFDLLREGWSASKEAYRMTGNAYYAELGMACLYASLELTEECGINQVEPLRELIQAYRTYPVSNSPTGRLVSEQKSRIMALMKEAAASPFHKAFREGNYSEAISHYNEEETHSVNDQMRYALSLLRDGFCKRAMEQLRHLREVNNEDRATWLLATVNLGACLLLQGQPAMFRQLFSELTTEERSGEIAQMLWRASTEKEASARAKRGWLQRLSGSNPTAEELRIELPQPYGWEKL